MKPCGMVGFGVDIRKAGFNRIQKAVTKIPTWRKPAPGGAPMRESEEKTTEPAELT
jgi:hypothetical protein